MATNEELKTQLAAQVEQRRGFDAERTAKTLGADASPVLMRFIEHKSVDVRRTALEVAGQNSNPGNGRVIISFLDDPDPEIRDLAVALLGKCSYRPLLPNLIEASKKHPESGIRGPLALQIGIVGGKTEVPLLQSYYPTAKEPQLHRDLDLALARLGEAGARNRLIARIEDPDQATRYQALQDCIYVRDKSLAKHFGPALKDYRVVVRLTIPENAVQKDARVCDLAVMVMANLGHVLSYPGEPLQSLTEIQLEEARKVVEAMNQQQPSK
jgi:HEAT repeat protein